MRAAPLGSRHTSGHVTTLIIVAIVVLGLLCDGIAPPARYPHGQPLLQLKQRPQT